MFMFILNVPVKVLVMKVLKSKYNPRLYNRTYLISDKS